MTNVSVRRLGAEALGTLILTFFGGAAVIGAAINGFDPGLLGPLAFGLALFTAVNVVGPISGAHVNPTVTLALAARGRFPWREVPAYVVAQLVGGLLAGALLFFVWGQRGITHGGLATTTIPATWHAKLVLAAILAEALGTFLLCFTVISMTDPDREGSRPVALGIGLSLAVGALAVGGLTGGSFNFARTFGPQVVAALAGAKGGWHYLWVYLVGPVIGALVAAYLHGWLSGRSETVVVAPVPTARKGGAKARAGR